MIRLSPLPTGVLSPEPKSLLYPERREDEEGPRWGDTQPQSRATWMKKWKLQKPDRTKGLVCQDGATLNLNRRTEETALFPALSGTVGVPRSPTAVAHCRPDNGLSAFRESGLR